MTEEHKRKLKEGRLLAKQKKDAGIPLSRKKSKVYDKPIVQYTGKETNAFDFIPLIRTSFRKQHNYVSIQKIVFEISDRRFWDNINWILTTLEKYVILEKVDSSKSIKQKRTRKPMTEEQRQAACERLKKAREARGKK